MKNYSSHPYLDALAEVYDDLSVPVFLTDEKLHLLYANEAAISNDRSLCSEDGILRMLGAEASAVRQALCSRDTFRLELHRPLPFYAVLFIRLYGSFTVPMGKRLRFRCILFAAMRFCGSIGFSAPKPCTMPCYAKF